jgi:16S rRNA (uracil1498-N3)-methyltransferase
MLTLFFVDDLPRKVGSTYEFDSEDSQHAIRVLRMGAGEIFMLSDGQGKWSKVKIFAVKKKSLEVEVIETGMQDPLEISFTVVQALPKGDRLKECIEMLTEGGVDTIIPWAAQHSIGKAEKGVEKLQITAREASKQSRRLFIPAVSDVASTAKLIELIAVHELVLVFHESATSKVSEIVTKKYFESKKVMIIIGPEGGITNEELELFKSAGAKVALMGRPILRSAHAGLAAMSAVNALVKVW